jgi:hypothetical protein
VDGVLTVMPEHGSGGTGIPPGGETGTGGIDQGPGDGGPSVRPDDTRPDHTAPAPSAARVTLPSRVVRGAQYLTEDRRMGGYTGLLDLGYEADERKDNPSPDTAPASEDTSTDNAPISILGGLVQINPKLARLLGLDAGL